jgi:hypothetical protein
MKEGYAIIMNQSENEAIAKAVKALKEARRRAVEADIRTKAAEERLVEEQVMSGFWEGRVNGSRRGTTQGSAFLWIDLYGKSKMDTAFRKIVKEKARLMANYRGSKNAWYLGSQSDVSHYDGAVAMARYLDANGISASQCDEWD